MNSASNAAPVSVIIPCFRCAATIGRAVDSVFRQTYPPVEVILVDDASSDGTFGILMELKNRYPEQVKIVSMIENVGAASARNAGWIMASQPYIAFLDADDAWRAEKLQIQCSYMVSHPEIVLCGHQWIMIDADSKATDISEKWVKTQVNPRHALFKNPFATSTIMVVRDIPFRFEEKMRSAEDWLLWLRITLAELSAVRLEVPLGYVYKALYGSDGLSRNLWRMEKGELFCLATLYREGSINWLLFGSSVFFSMLKFFRRVVNVHIMRRLTGVNLSLLGSNKP